MEFGRKLRSYREQAGMSQNALARASGLNPASINRLESGERSPSNRAIVERIADALSLSPSRRDELLASAGHLPEVYERVRPSDPTLLAVAEVLAEPSLSAEDVREFRAILEAIARRWKQGNSGRTG